ncbi:glycoside hydrolase family 16 protein [Nocardioides sp. YIM 152315]|uniref:glycoside hydrolase family 16 protein n=1 Tax=Nocardioides sp. YIM 152315 TaxID=3031760 RepID=UPI0023DA62E3|nr:glycoside hydrolase family 16 protein [Nocardioides sp. YIM 152315]MDF1604958.1 glycoside hydrolase family 16 protein [Nocardioides sp. YIM 152315]
MTSLRTFAAALALTVGAGLAVATVDAPAGTAAPASKAHVQKKKAKQRVKIELTPPISSVGKRPARSDRAKVVVAGTFRPKKPGRTVILDRKAGKKWVRAGAARQDKSGVVQIAAPYLRKRKAVTYRLRATGSGMPTTVSKKVSTLKWTYKEQFTDEFSGSDLDASTWSFREQDYGHAGLRECSRTEAANTRVGHNVARLVVGEDKARPGRCKYDHRSFAWRTNAMIGTEGAFAFKYGYAAARVKLNRLRGQHFGFWLQPTNRVAEYGSARKTGAEIDVVEWFGEKHPSGGLSSYIHYVPRKNHGVKVGSWIKKPQQYGNKWSKKYHVFSVKWTPRSYTFYIDGQVTSVIKKGVSGREQFLLLSQLSSDYQLKYMKKEKKLPQGSSVDWVRVWKL